ncbi:unnamed protein product [Caenorhabditis nigoni]
MRAFTRILFYCAFVTTILTSAVHGAQNKDQIIEDLSAVARIVTAISLKNGLLDGSIPSDDVISELLNIESEVLKKLESYEKTKVGDYLNNLRTSKMEDSETVDKAMKNLHLLQSSWSTVDGLGELPDQQKYNKLNEIKTLDVSMLSKNLLDPISKILEKVEWNDQDVSTMESELKSILPKIKSDGKVNLEEIIQILEKLKPLTAVAHTIELYSLLPDLSTTSLGTEVDYFLANLKTLKGFASSKDSVSVLGAIQNVVNSRLIPHSLNRNFTSGFINRYDDFEKVSEDLKNPFWRKSYHSKKDIGGFETLKELQKPLKELDESWKKVSTEKTFYSSRQFSVFYQLLSSIDDQDMQKNDLEQVLSSVDTCVVAIKGFGAIENFMNTFSQTARLSLQKVKALNNLYLMSKKIQKDLIPMNSSDTEIVANLKLNIQKMESDLKIVLGDPKFADIDFDNSNSKYVTQFKSQQPINKMEESIKCLRGLESTSSLKKVMKAGRLAFELREIQKDAKLLENLRTMAEQFSGTSQSLKSIRELIKKNKKEAVSENFKNLQPIAKSFGDAVNSLVMMNKAIEKSEDLSEFLRLGRAVNMEADLITSDEDFAYNWGDFEETSKNIEKLLTKIEAWLPKMKISTKPGLLAFGSVFAENPKLEDIDLKTENRLEAGRILEKLAKTPELKKDIQTFQKSLLENSKLDLKFSRFQTAISNFPNILQQLSEFLNPSEASGTPLPQMSSAPFPVMMCVYVLVGLLVLLVIVIYTVLFCKRKNPKWTKHWNRATCGLCAPKKKPNTTSSSINSPTSEADNKTTPKPPGQGTAPTPSTNSALQPPAPIAGAAGATGASGATGSVGSDGSAGTEGTTGHAGAARAAGVSEAKESSRQPDGAGSENGGQNTMETARDNSVQQPTFPTETLGGTETLDDVYGNVFHKN